MPETARKFHGAEVHRPAAGLAQDRHRQDQEDGAGLSALRDEIAAILERGGIAGAAVEADRIVRAAKTSTPAGHEDAARAMAERRAQGVPLAYVIGHEVFMGVELIAAAGALAPRQETELLGNTALAAIRAAGSASPRIVDMCCGSGNLACALARHLPAARVWASDLTGDCAAIARRNAMHTGVADRVVVAQGDLFAALAGIGLENSIDAVVCNPPYISQGKLTADSAALLLHEPREAFDGGPYGLSIQQRVVKAAPPFLRPGGLLLFEIGLGQDRQIKTLFERAKAYEDIRFFANAAGEVRVASGRRRAA